MDIYLIYPMHIYKKILVLIIIIIFSYLLFKLIKTRREITQKSHIENFTPNSIDVQATNNKSLLLREYCIKSSINSAYNSSKYAIDCDNTNPNNILTTILKRGVRFLDFEIYSLDEKPIVGYSTFDSENTQNEATNTTNDTFIYLDKVFETILKDKPLITDPLFIQLRIKTEKTKLYEIINEYILNGFKGSLYTGKITGDTRLSDIDNKIIIVVDDKRSNKSYKNSRLQTSGLVNLETSNGITVFSTTQLIDSDNKRININTDGVSITTNEKTPVWTLSYPDVMDTKNPDIYTLMNKQCPNIIQCRFDKDDNNLALYESLFKTQGFVPLGSAYSIASKWPKPSSSFLGTEDNSSRFLFL